MGWATVQAAGTGWANSGSSYPDIVPSGTKVLYVGPKDNAADGGFSRTGMGTVSIDANGNTVIDSVDVNVYSEGLTSFRISPDIHQNTATIKSLSVLADSTITVGISGWNQNVFTDLIIESLTVANAGAAVINVETGQTATLGQVNGSYTAAVAGTLKLTGSHTYSAANTITGDGWLVVTDGAVLTLNHGGSHGAVKTNLKVEGGATLECLKGDSAAGWGAVDQGPNMLTLAGTAATDSTPAKLATMALSGKQTIGQGISMQGNAQITNAVNSTGAIELYKEGEVLTVSGENNFIYSDVQIGTHANIINVEENGELTISGNFYTQSNHTGASLTKAGDGALVFSGTSTFDKVYTHGAGTTTFGGKATFSGGMQVTSGGVEFEDTSEITLKGAINVGNNGSVTFNENNLTLDGSKLKKNPYLAGQTFTTNGKNELSVEYTIVTGNQAGVTGTVKVEGVDQVQEINQGKVLSADTANYYVIAETGSSYDNTAHRDIENFGGYLVTNKATFDLNLADDATGFQPHLYLDEGSVITNNNANLGTDKIAILHATLLGDAEVNVAKDKQFGMLRNSWWESTLSLAGHTLNKTGDGIFHLVNTTVSDGVISVTGGRVLVESKTASHPAGTVFKNAIVQLGELGTLQINSMKDAASAGALLADTKGTGTIELNTTASLTGTDGTGQKTKAEGGLTINSGGILRIGGGDKQVNDISSFNQVSLNGGTIRYENKGGTVNGLTVTAEGGKLDMYDMGREADGDSLVFDKITTLNGKLTYTNVWNSQTEFKKLSGAGNLVVDGAGVIDGYGRQGSDNSTITVSGVDNYTGKVQMKGNVNNMKISVDEGLGLGVEYGYTEDSTNISATGHADLSAIAAGNTVTFMGFTGYLTGAADTGTVAADISLSNDNGPAINWTNADQTANLKFTGSVSGVSNLAFGVGKGHHITFTGEISGHTGTIWGSVAGDDGAYGTTITYAGDASVINHNVHSGRENNITGKTKIVYQNKEGVAVNGSINTDQWGLGTVDILVKNENESATGEVTFTGSAKLASATIEAGTKATFTDASVTVDDILVKAAAQLSFSGVESLSVARLETNDGSSVTVGTIENHVGKVLTVTNQATFNGGTINADLKLADGAKVAFNGTVEMGSTLTLGTNLTLSGTKLEEIKSLTSASQTVVLFTGVDTLTLGEQSFSMAENQVLTASDNVTLSRYFTTEDDTNLDNYFLGFNAAGDLYAGLVVPEPATATLSLLALAGLCARRRRKS